MELRKRKEETNQKRRKDGARRHEKRGMRLSEVSRLDAVLSALI